MVTSTVIEVSGDESERRGGVGPDSDFSPFRLHLEFGALPAGVESERDRRRLLLILTHPDFPGLMRQIIDVGGCVDPIRVQAATLRSMPVAGGIAAEISARDLPAGVVLIRCMNRRASRCPSCARIYQGDTYQLVRAGIAGGKGVPVAVPANPQVFATLTAPSFGAVHKATGSDKPNAVCKKRFPAKCPHGRERGCLARHEPGDPLVGQALCPECYDYPRQVVWNAHASKLCKGLMDNLYHRLARHAGVPRGEIRRLVRVEYARVAEYQARGAVHFHILFRLDGPEGPGSPAPAWASPEVLIEALDSASTPVVHRDLTLCHAMSARRVR
ncbi:MAG TPA: replication initiator [Trebonia sp.]|nr:replication initiator [Trebonia sp.]